MGKFRLLKNSFLGGELSPTAFGRADSPQHQAGCKTLRNMIPLLSGGAYRRPGSYFEKEYAYASFQAPKIFPFIYSQSEVYAVVLKRSTGGSPSGTAEVFRTSEFGAGPATITAVGGTHPYRQANSTFANGFIDELFEVDHTQSADILYLVHEKHKPRRIVRTATDTFSFVEFDNGLSGTALRDAWPYRRQNPSSSGITMTPSATSGNITITASSAFFNAGHVGSYIKINHSGTYGAARITGFTSSTVVNATVIVNFGATGSVTTWWESAWSDYRGWPRTITFFQDRLIYGGNTAQPDHVWHSAVSNYDKLSTDATVDPVTETTNANAFTVELLSRQLNKIQWMSPGKTLTLGTTGDEFVLTSIDPSIKYGGGNVSVSLETSYGSAKVRPYRVGPGNEVIFTTKNNSEVRSLVFNVIQDAYSAEPLQILFDEYPKAQIGANSGIRRHREFTWDTTRRTLWGCDTRGNFYSLTRDRNLQLNMWATHQMGGYDADVTSSPIGTSTDEELDEAYRSPSGSVISVCAIPNPKTNIEDIWLCVKRYISGAWAYHIERITGGPIPYESAYDTASSIVSGNLYVDCGCHGVITTATNFFDFLGDITRFDGEDVVGTFYGTKGLTVASGSVVGNVFTLDNAVIPTSALAIGLPFDSYIEPTRIEAGSQIGTSQGAVKRVHEAHIRFYRTLSAKVGRDRDHLEALNFRDASTPMDSGPELFTGDKRVKVDMDYNRDGFMIILQDEPLPFAVMAIILEGVTND